MRIGLMFGGSDGSLAGAAAQARRAEQSGFATLWFPNIFGLDAITAAAIAGRDAAAVIASRPKMLGNQSVANPLCSARRA